MKWSLLAAGLVVAVLVVGLVMSMRQPDELRLATVCKVNIRQLAVASLNYCQDYNGQFAPHQNWTGSLSPYMMNRQMLACPSVLQLPVGYAYDKRLSSKPFGKIACPAETLMFAESDKGGPNPADLLDFPKLPARHNGGANVGFTDGHVKWYQPTGHYP